MDLDNEIDVSRRFFGAIKIEDLNEIIIIFRDQRNFPWLYLEDDEYTGKFNFQKDFPISQFFIYINNLIMLKFLFMIFLIIPRYNF